MKNIFCKLIIVLSLFVLTGSPVYAFFCMPSDNECKKAEAGAEEAKKVYAAAEKKYQDAVKNKKEKEYNKQLEIYNKSEAEAKPKPESNLAGAGAAARNGYNDAKPVTPESNLAGAGAAARNGYNDAKPQPDGKEAAKKIVTTGVAAVKPATGGVDPNASNPNNTNQAAVNQDSSAQTRTNPTTNNRSTELTEGNPSNATNSSTNSSANNNRSTELTDRNSSTTTNNSTNSSSNNSSDPSRSSNRGASNNSYTDSPSSNSNSFRSAQYGGIASTASGPVQSNQGIGGYADNLVNQFGLPTDFLGQLVQIFTQLLQRLVNALLGLVQSLIGGFNPIQQPNYLQNPNSSIINIGNQLGLGGGNILGGQLLGPIAGGALNVFPQNQYPQNFNPTQFVSTAANTFPVQTIGNQAQSLLQSTTYNPIFNNLIGGQNTNGIQQIANKIAQPEQNTLFSTESVIGEIQYSRGTVFKGETINVNGKLVANGKGIKYFNSTLPGAYSSCEGTFQNGQADCLYNNGDRWIGFDLEDPNTIGYGTIIKKDGTKISGTYQGDKLISR